MCNASRQMESELIQMTGDLFGQKDIFGVTTNCGTESVLHAMLAYKKWGEKKGIRKPNM